MLHSCKGCGYLYLFPLPVSSVCSEFQIGNGKTQMLLRTSDCVVSPPNKQNEVTLNTFAPSGCLWCNLNKTLVSFGLLFACRCRSPGCGIGTFICWPWVATRTRRISASRRCTRPMPRTGPCAYAMPSARIRASTSARSRLLRPLATRFSWALWVSGGSINLRLLCECSPGYSHVHTEGEGE